MTQKWYRGYKVVRTDYTKKSEEGHTSFESMWSDRPVTYELDKIARCERGCGPLGVFEKYDDALRCASYRDDRVILECKFTKSKRRKFYYTTSGGYKIVEDGATKDNLEAITYATQVKPIAVVYQQQP
jgi:hypothetical protein